MIDPERASHWMQQLVDGDEIDWAQVEAEFVAQPQQVEQLRRVQRLLKGFAQVVRVEQSDPRWDTAFRWGHLRVGELLGRGGHGLVYRAFDSVLEREVALKLRSPESPGVSNFISEARRLARVRHPHVLPIHGAAVHDGRAGLWADLIEGESLSAWVQRHGAVPVHQAITMALHLAGALQAVHAAGLVHGDVKPANIMRDSQTGRLVLMDFGSAADSEHAARHGLLGSPNSMSSEQLRGEAVGPSTDIYGLGVVLFHLLHARFPVNASSVGDIAQEHARGDVQRRVAQSSALPRPVRQLLSHMLASDARQRPDASSLVGRLNHFLAAPLRRRRVLALSTVIASLVMALVTSLWALWRVENERDEAVAAREREMAVSGLMQDLLRAPDPAVAGSEVRVVDVLSEAVLAARLRFADTPHLQVQALRNIGNSLRSLGHHDTALAVLEEALVLAQSQASGSPETELDLRRLVLETRFRLEPGVDQNDALAALHRSAAITLGESHPLSVAVLLDRATRHFERNDLAMALPLAQRGLELRPTQLAADRAQRAAALNLIGMIDRQSGRHALAEQRFEEARAVMHATGDLTHPQAFAARHSLALLARDRGDLQAAEALHRDELALMESRLGARHRHLRTVLSNLGGILQEQGRIAEALPFLQRAVDLNHRFAPPQSLQSLAARINLANALADLGEHQRARSERMAVHSLTREHLGADHPTALIAAINLAEQHLHDEEFEQARILAEDAMRRCHTLFGPRHAFSLAAELLWSRARFQAAPGHETAAGIADTCKHYGAGEGEDSNGHLDCLLQLGIAMQSLDDGSEGRAGLVALRERLLSARAADPRIRRIDRVLEKSEP